MTDEQISTISKSIDPDVRELLNEYIHIKSSPHFKAYNVLKKQMEDQCDQLEIKEIGKDGEGNPIYKGRIDLFSDKDSKESDREHKFWGSYQDRTNTLEFLWNKMTAKEQEDTIKDKKFKKLSGVAI